MPENEEKRPKVYLKEYKLQQDPQDYGFADEPFTLEKFKQKFKIVIVK